LQDLAGLRARIAERHPGAPQFVLGHSLGALIVLDYVQSSPDGLAGAVVSGAPIEPAGVARPHRVAIARLLSRSWPSFTLKLDLGGSALSRDPAQAAAYESDPLVHRVATARWGTECLAAVQRVRAHPDSIRLPVLVLHGEKDPLNQASGTRAFFERIGSEDKQLIIYPGSLHEPHNDLDAARVAEDLTGWIGAHRV
jgi:alpha-beta hydrolase superfamily lysophospholipase